MRVLITGGSGFLGRQALAPLLDADCEVHAAGRSRLDVPGITWHPTDLLDHDEIERTVTRVAPEALLHLAWSVEPGRFWTDPANLSWVAATSELVRAFAASGGRRFVAAGTCAEYDWESLGDGVCREASTPCRPRTLYGVAKHSLFRLTSAFGEEHGLSVAWGRIFLLFGSHEHPDRLVPGLIRSLLAGEPARLTSGTQQRDLSDTRDAGAAFATLLLSGVRGPVNIASGEATTVADVASHVAAKLERPDLVQLGALPERAKDPPTLLADVGRLRDEVGHVPRHSLWSGLDDTVAWWRARLSR